MKRKNGGRGLIGIEECVASEQRSLNYYLANSEEILLKFIATESGLVKDNIETKEVYKKRIEAEKKGHIEGMKLHGQFERETKDLKTEDSWKWLCSGDLKRETESLIIRAQDQTLNTNVIKKQIYGIGKSNTCRLCGEKVESVTHIVSACKMLAQREYKRRHDKVCSYLHWSLCRKYKFEVTDKWYQHIPEKVLENQEVKLLWDWNVQTDREIEHRRPDILLIKKESNECMIIDVANPGDHNVEKKQFEKINNYAELRLEISRMWNKKTTVVPVIIGALGSVPHKLGKYLNILEIKYDLQTLQKSVLLGTANILRKVLCVDII